MGQDRLVRVAKWVAEIIQGVGYSRLDFRRNEGPWHPVVQGFYRPQIPFFLRVFFAKMPEEDDERGGPKNMTDIGFAMMFFQVKCETKLVR